MRRVVRGGARVGDGGGGSGNLGFCHRKTLRRGCVASGFRTPSSSSTRYRSRSLARRERFRLASWLGSRLDNSRRAGGVTSGIVSAFLYRWRLGLWFRSSDRCSRGWGRSSSRNGRLGLEGTRAFLEHRTHPAILCLASVVQASLCACVGWLPRHCSLADTQRRREAR